MSAERIAEYQAASLRIACRQNADPDVRVLNGGSMIILEPCTAAAEYWFEDNIGRDNGFQPYWPKVVVEARYVDDIIDGLQADGLTVR